MSKVTFRSKKPYFQLSYMDVFKVGFIAVPVVGGKPIRIMASLILTMQSVRSWVLRIQTAYTLGISLERERITMRLRWRMRMLLRGLELILHLEMIILLQSWRMVKSQQIQRVQYLSVKQLYISYTQQSTKEYPQRRGKHSPLTEEKSRTVILQMMRRRSRSLGIILRPEQIICLQR